ncbi:transcriptional regulator FeaR [Govanella unica]|uniref:Transcriptional regulator FeaR n=1 Tax=Govanella unica TaxID=2975056 RepID=A0A9X3TVP4_9PROT|nr:transcriptional regulator FeaR [Govania unica]MDA5192584.1 transcriptional regulator FeaR [Govania unica]
MTYAPEHMATETGQFEYWEQAVTGVCGALSAEPIRDRPFRGLVKMRRAGTINIVEHHSDIDRLIWTDRHIASAREEFCFLVVQRQGRTRLFQNGADSVIGPGDCVLVDSLRPVEFRYDSSGVDQLSFHLPRSQLVQRLSSRDVPCGHVLGGGSGSGAVLVAFARALYEQASTLAHDQTGFSDSLIDLLVAALSSGDQSLDGDSGGTAALQRRRIMSYLEQNLQDPDLSPGRVAADLGISIRHLHRLFSESGQSVSDWIWRQRLDRAARDLVEPRLRGRSILDIAFDWGFNDASHFSRAFRAVHGRSPREHRRLSTV